ncbi:3-oxoacid CoA-transferase subunit A [Agrobacterium sp. Ap1]|jgi:acetate CoA/acetoacetate CoA-transferase alpha subunit|uniref:CoA transferase subunit A n=1 Tax=Rhizobium/Agrobacterium group TaxID=227290 RepID=UPI001A8CDE3B|nr:3-oxoacid CoA-transferase subunit A [Agrobacterium sp. Ap1]MBO0143178.1 3-oxoacid CoA-transferase subunit A [Agrobacterium sp. Ap1]
MYKVNTAEEAVRRIPDGVVLMIGGFVGIGTPQDLVDELVRQGKKDLTLIANDTARPNVGVGKLIDAGLVKKAIVSHIGTNPVTQKQMIGGAIEVELVPQGTLAERVRAGGSGLGGVLTPTGVGTDAAIGKETIEINGIPYLLETALKADFALIKARSADYSGNLRYSLTSRNFNPLMAMAAEIVIAEPDEIVPVGCIEPDAVVTPHVLVDLLIAKGATI